MTRNQWMVLGGILAALVMFNLYGWWLGESFWEHSQPPEWTRMVDYWGWMSIGSRFLLFVIGLGGIVRLAEKRLSRFLFQSAMIVLTLFLLQFAMVSLLLPDVPVFLNNGEKQVSWDEVKSGTLLLFNIGWMAAGWVAVWMVYAFQRWKRPSRLLRA
ncbi:hypothetical protein [Staphylospora marina]|uniref:hypothetical protein n=1 Tax=Staphylospora marina TaxID=2490858 RepID=UPI000F5BB780|nr:hypothetical protein [Staphylospora marina]